MMVDKNFIDTSISCCCFIAGKNKRNENKLIFGFDKEKNGILSEIEIPISANAHPYMLASPPDMSSDECFDIFEKYIHFSPLDFIEKTIKYISTKSKLVSPTGDKWIYDIKSGKGELIIF